MSEESDWDSRCHRCGSCCFEKIEVEGEIYYTDDPCPHLVLGSRLCRIYDSRSRLKEGCVPICGEIISRGILPAHCAYVVGIPGYVAPHLGPVPFEYDEEQE